MKKILSLVMCVMLMAAFVTGCGGADETKPLPEVKTEAKAMDYRSLRRQFGRELRLIGGVDVDTLLLSRDAIRREIKTKVPPLLAQGGYVPLADGRVRVNVPWENYVYYRQVLEEVTRV